MHLAKLIIIGAGGFGKEVAWVAANMNAIRPTFDLLGFCDDRAVPGTVHFGLPVLGSIEAARDRFGAAVTFACAIGDNATREKIAVRAATAGWSACAPLVDPSVIVAPGATVGRGSYVGAGCILSPDSRIGEHVIVNQHCSIGHDSTLEDFSQVCPGGRVNGHVRLGRGAFVGSGAVLMQKVSMGEGAVLGAASFALKNIPAGVTAVGNPARPIFIPSSLS